MEAEQAQNPTDANMKVAAYREMPPKDKLEAWLPSIVWMSILFLLSTTFFSAANTSRIIIPILRYIFPHASIATIALMHGLIRKCAHFFNYCVLFWLLIRGPLAGRPYTALAICIGYAFLDEGHQIFAAGRTPSLYDVTLDSSGALFSRFLNEAVMDASHNASA